MIAFLVLIASCFVAAASSWGQPSHTALKVWHYKDDVPLSQLNETLSLPIHDKAFQVEGEWRSTETAPEQMARLFAAAADKQTPRTIADQFSVSDLLALNECRLDDCANGELDRRQEVCQAISRREDEERARGWRPLPRVASLGHAHHNLIKYCSQTYANCMTWCQERLHQVAERLLRNFDSRAKNRVLNFERKVNEFNGGFNPGSHKVAVAAVLRDFDAERRAKLITACQVLVSIMSKIHRINLDQTPISYHTRRTWRASYRYCLAALGSAEASGPK